VIKGVTFISKFGRTILLVSYRKKTGKTPWILHGKLLARAFQKKEPYVLGCRIFLLNPNPILMGS
jgi:hypothetical protein